MGIFDEAKVRAVLDLPAEQMGSAIIAIGHPAEQPVCPKRKDVDTLLQFV